MTARMLPSRPAPRPFPGSRTSILAPRGLISNGGAIKGFSGAFLKTVALALFLAVFNFILAAPACPDTLRMVYPEAPKSLDPHHYPPDPAAWPIIMTVYKRLFDLRPGSSDLDNTSSAASTYRVSDDGKIYTILLQEGQTFSDGTPVDSMAALASFDRLMGTQTGRVYFAPLRFLEIVGPYTFRLHLEKPWPPFMAALTTPMASLVSPSAAQKPSDFLDKGSLGSGRFEVESFEGSKLAMRIRPDAPSVPKLNRVEIVFEGDPEKRAQMVNSGEAHLAWDPARPEKLAENVEWRLVPTFETRFLAFNMTRPYQRMDAVREALAALAIATLGAERPFRPAGFFPSGLASGIAQTESPETGALLERAKSVLATIGPSRSPLDLAFRADDPSGRTDAEKLQAAMRDFGLSARTVPLAGAHGQGLFEKADWDLLLDWRRPQLPGPEMWLGGFLDSRGTIAVNPARYDDPDADRLIEELGASDRQERARTVRRLAILALDKRPYVMLYQKPLALLVDKRLSGLFPHPMWPEVWPVDSTNLDPFKSPAPPQAPSEPAGPLIPGFDNPVAEPCE